jgi:hypothetical protein
MQMSTSISYVYLKTPLERQNRVLAWFDVCTLCIWYFGPIRRARNCIQSKGRKPNKHFIATTDPPIKNFRANLKKRLTTSIIVQKMKSAWWERPEKSSIVLYCISKAMSIATTEIRKAMKGVSANWV